MANSTQEKPKVILESKTLQATLTKYHLEDGQHYYFLSHRGSLVSVKKANKAGLNQSVKLFCELLGDK